MIESLLIDSPLIDSLVVENPLIERSLRFSV